MKLFADEKDKKFDYGETHARARPTWNQNWIISQTLHSTIWELESFMFHSVDFGMKLLIFNYNINILRNSLLKLKSQQIINISQVAEDQV